MLELKFVRAHPEIVRADLTKRGDTEKLSWVDEVLEMDRKARRLTVAIGDLRNRRNVISREISQARKKGEAITALIDEAKSLPATIKEMETERDTLIEAIRYRLMRLPNILHESVPVGKDDSENVEIKRWGEPKVPAFDLENHGALAVEHDWADFERAVKISGSGFYFLKGRLVLLDMALQRFAMDLLVARGYTPITPPYMMNRAAYEGVTDLADFENVMYKIDDEDAYLIATSEHPMAAMYSDEIFEEEDLPIRLAGVSPCFRREIGAHGIDTRGLFRVHQFHKIEQFIYATPEQSWDLHEELLANAETVFQRLGLPYRVVVNCTGDIGTVAAKKYDLEVWMPREERYREAVSCSNCTAYQAVRLNIKVRDPVEFTEKRYVHTLNSTAIATSRAIRAILENYQNEDGSVTIPEPLRPYLYGDEVL
jgi:seryl-tRNA synthetase